MNDEMMTDEDKMIRKLTEHRNVIDLVEKLGKLNNIDVQRTVNNDPNGDFKYPKEQEDALIAELDKLFPGKRDKYE